MLAHNVYFTLADNSLKAKENLLAACKKYLTGHPGVVFYAAGTLANEFERPANDRDFDVVLQVVFDGKPSHDIYQQSERHQTFLAENKAGWKKVRVFDAYIES
jgi:hypothetical protein